MTTARGTEIILRLRAPEQLFEVAPADMLSEHGRLESGMEQLIGERRLAGCTRDCASS